MLSRVLEPEVMDSPAEALDYDAMDHTAVNRAFVDDLLAACPEAQPVEESDAPDAEYDDTYLDILDLGTGTAQIPIELCRRNPRLRVMGIDMAAWMLDLGRGNVEVASLTNRIRLDRVDAKDLPYPDGRFAIVMSNSIVHHIPEPRAVLAQAVRVLAPGGLFFFRDLVRPDDDANVARLVEAYAAGANAHQRQMFEDSLRAALSLDEVRELASEVGLSPEAVRATSDRHWTLATRRR